MTVLYLISKLLTFPAALLRAVYEHILLKLFRIPIENPSYFVMNELFGHTEHDFIKKASKSFWFCVIPGFLQVILAVPMMLISFLQLYILGVTLTDPVTGELSIMFVLCMIFRILGIWLLGNVFPLYEDSLNLYEQVCELKGVKKILLFPIAAIIRAGSFLERFGVTVWLLIIEAVLLLLVF